MPPHTLKSTVPALACLHLPMMVIVDLEDVKRVLQWIFIYLLIRSVVFYVAKMLLQVSSNTCTCDCRIFVSFINPGI